MRHIKAREEKHGAGAGQPAPPPYAAPPHKRARPLRTDADRTPPAHGTALRPGTRPSPHPSKRTVACRHCRGCSRIRLCQNFAQRHAQRRLHPFRPEPKAHRSPPVAKNRPDILPPEKCRLRNCRMYIRFLPVPRTPRAQKSIRPAKPAAEKENTPEKGAQPCRSLRPQEHRPERYLQESPATFPQPLRWISACVPARA